MDDNPLYGGRPNNLQLMDEHRKLRQHVNKYGKELELLWRTFDQKKRERLVNAANADGKALKHRGDKSDKRHMFFPEWNLRDLCKPGSDYLFDLMHQRSVPDLIDQYRVGMDGLGDKEWMEKSMRDNRLNAPGRFPKSCYIMFVDSSQYGTAIQLSTPEQRDAMQIGISMGNIVPQDVGEMILLRQLWTMQSLNDLVDAIIADAQAGEAATSGSSRHSKTSQQQTDDLIFGKRPKKPSSTNPKDPTEKTTEELLKFKIGGESGPEDESPLAPLLGAAEEQKRAHEVYLSMLSTDEEMFAEDVRRCFSSRPELVADDKGRALPLQADKHSTSAVLDAAHNAVKNVVVWTWIHDMVDKLDDATTGDESHENDKFYHSIVLQELSNVCNYEYTRAQSLLRRNLSKGSKLMKRVSNGLDPSGNHILKLKGKPQDFEKSDPQLHILLTLCQPEITAAKAIPWLKKLGDLYQKIPLEREKFPEEVVDSLGSLAIIVNFAENATKAISMPPPSRKKGLMFITRMQELEAEVNELKKDLDLSGFAVPIGKLKEQGRIEGALKHLDEFLVEKAGAKMSDMYGDLFADCGSYLDKQHKDAKDKGKMDWTPLPIEAPKTKEEAIEYRRMTAKGHATDPNGRTKLYDLIHSSTYTAAVDKAGSHIIPPGSIQVDSLAFETFTKLFGTSKPRKRIIWEDLEYSLEEMGFSSRSIYGICTYFIADEAIAKLPLTIKHPYKSEVSGRTSVMLARRWTEAYGWNASAFQLVL